MVSYPLQTSKNPGKKKSAEANWNVTYQPGRLQAVGFRQGIPVTTNVVETTGEPAALQVQLTRREMPAAWGEVSLAQVAIVDSQGRRVPTDAPLLEFKWSGPAKWLGVGNGDPKGLENEQTNVIHAYGGLAMGLIQGTPTNGVIQVEVTSPSLTGAKVSITTVPTKPVCPEVPVSLSGEK